jgi:hypothetical protein
LALSGLSTRQVGQFNLYIDIMTFSYCLVSTLIVIHANQGSKP